MDLARRAVTTTPSIFPSASELTMPVSAESPPFRAALLIGGKAIAVAVATRVKMSLARIGHSSRKLRHRATLKLRRYVGTREGTRMLRRCLSAILAMGIGAAVHAADDIEAKAQACAACHGNNG